MIHAHEYRPHLAFGLLLLGPPKTGKTRICLSFPNPYIADLDNNLSGAVRHLRETNPEKDFRFDVIPMTEDGKLIAAEDQWERLLQCINVALADPWVKTIVIDSASTLAYSLQAFIVNKKAGTKVKEMTISDWIPFRNLLTKLVMDLRASGRFLVVTSHEENVKDEVSGRIIVRTNIPSKLADNFGGFFSDCWRTEIETGTDGSPRYVVRAAPTTIFPHIGNSLGLKPTFVFSTDKLAELLEQNRKEQNSKGNMPILGNQPNKQ